MLIKPFVLLAIMAGVVLPIELVLSKFLPDSRLKLVLFDKTFRDRRPFLFFVWWAVIVALMWAILSIYL